MPLFPFNAKHRRIRLCCAVKNEADIIAQWLQYHGEIFGFGSITMLDNMSDDGTYEILQSYVKHGIVLRRFKDFRQKHEEVTDVLLESKADADILMPLDADEFVYAEERGQPSVEKHTILHRIDSLPYDGRKWKFLGHKIAVNNRDDYKNPLVEMTHFIDSPLPRERWKTFFPAESFVKTDQGNHKGQVLGDNTPHYTRLGLFHFQIRGYDHFIRKMHRGALAYRFSEHNILDTGAGSRWKEWYATMMNKGSRCAFHECWAHAQTCGNGKECRVLSDYFAREHMPVL